MAAKNREINTKTHIVYSYDRLAQFLYSEEERQLLGTIVEHEYRGDSVSCDVRVGSLLGVEGLEDSAGFRKVMWAAFEDVPLFINDESADARITAMWRLKLGR